MCVSGCGEVVIVPRTRHLDSLEVLLRREAADDDCQVVRRARSRPEGLDLLVEELLELVRVQERLGLLEQEGLVGRSSALCHEVEVVLVALGRVDLDLGREVAAGVLLREHVLRRNLAVAEVALGVGVVDATSSRGLIMAVRPDAAALLAHDDRGSCVLAAGQHLPGCDVGVLEQLQGNKAVVGGRLVVLEDVGELLQVACERKRRSSTSYLGCSTVKNPNWWPHWG